MTSPDSSSPVHRTGASVPRYEWEAKKEEGGRAVLVGTITYNDREYKITVGYGKETEEMYGKGQNIEQLIKEKIQKIKSDDIIQLVGTKISSSIESGQFSNTTITKDHECHKLEDLKQPDRSWNDEEVAKDPEGYKKYQLYQTAERVISIFNEKIVPFSINVQEVTKLSEEQRKEHIKFLESRWDPKDKTFLPFTDIEDLNRAMDAVYHLAKEGKIQLEGEKFTGREIVEGIRKQKTVKRLVGDEDLSK